MDKITLGPKEVGSEDSYKDLFEFIMNDLKIIECKWVLWLKYKRTGESVSSKFIHYKREYVPQLSALLSEMDFEGIAKLPCEKNDCAFRLEIRYTKTGSFIGLQLTEARVGVNGGYFSISPAMVFTDDEADDAYDQLKAML